MKKLLAIFLMFAVIMTSCGPKPMYKTAKGKKKLKHYNALQFNDPRAK